jgi:hypothetical protein
VRLALDDDGTVRFIDMAAGSVQDGRHPAVAELMQMGYPGSTLHNGSVVYDANVWWETLDLVRLIGRIAESCGYSGSWLLGAELTGMRDHHSSTWGNNECDADQLTTTSRVTTRGFLDRPRYVASALLRARCSATSARRKPWTSWRKTPLPLEADGWRGT